LSGAASLLIFPGIAPIYLELPRFRGQLITDTIKGKRSDYDKAKKPVSSSVT